MVDFHFISELLWIHHLAQGRLRKVTCSEALLPPGWSIDYSASVDRYQQPDSDPKLAGSPRFLPQGDFNKRAAARRDCALTVSGSNSIHYLGDLLQEPLARQRHCSRHKAFESEWNTFVAPSGAYSTKNLEDRDAFLPLFSFGETEA